MWRLSRLSLVYGKLANKGKLKWPAGNFLKQASISTTAMAKGDMFSQESKLPRLPVPDLDDTMEKYITTLEPIMFESEYEDTKKIVSEFVKRDGVGEDLQGMLIEKASKSDNWLAEWWDRCAYFGYRESVVINSSPGIKFPDQVFYSDIDQYRFTAKLIHSVLEFKELVDNEKIPVDYAGKDPLSMYQYTKLLSTCRVPQPKCDKEVHTPPKYSRHVIVSHNNHLFTLDVYKSGTTVPLTEEELIQQLGHIANSSRIPNEYSVGVLTAQNRNIWAQAYRRLTKDYKNKSNIEKIEKSICLICLDQPIHVPNDANSGYENGKHSAGLAQMLHGGGSSQNSMNRWFDKICQFVVNRNGMNGLCYEHSVAEGPPVMVLCNMIMKNKIEPSYSDSLHTVNANLKLPEKLTWNLNYDMIDRIELAMDDIDQAADDVELRLFQFSEFGKNVPKRYRVSPDAFFQVSLQLAYWRLYSHHPPTYESGSIRKFFRGRTECIRSATPQVARYAREMDRKNYDESGKRELFMKAVQAHVNYTVDAMQFRAIDRHMLGLKLIALENSVPLPEIFRDKAFGYAMHFRLSTSQVASKHEACLAFGPVVPDGYGVCYNPMENQFIYAVSAYFSHPKTRAADLGNAIAKALIDNHKLLATKSHL